MKKGAILLSLAMVLSSAAVTVGDGKDASAAKKVKLAKSKITVKVKQTKKIKIKGVKKKQVKKITVKSKKTSICNSKKSGKVAIKVTGKKKGSTKVIVNLKLKKKVGGKKKYKLTLKVEVKKGAPTPTATPTPDTRTATTVKTVELKDMTYYIGQKDPTPLDASKTTVTPPEAATGGAVTYQWYMGPATGSAVEVATTAQYAPDITKAGTFSVYYTAKFTPTEQYKKTYQESSATSNKATITVLEKVPITFDANGGTFGTGTNAKTELKKEYEWGKDLGTLPLESEMSPPSTTTGGRDLLGWAMTKTASSGNVSSNTKATEAVTYYAVWGTRQSDPSPSTPSAPTPVITGLEYADSENVRCTFTVDGPSALTFQWYYIMGPYQSETENTETNVIPVTTIGDAVGSSGSKVYVRAINSPSGYSSSASAWSEFAFVHFCGETGDNIASGTRDLIKRVGDTVNISEAPDVSNSSSNVLLGWGESSTGPATLSEGHPVTVNGTLNLFPVWQGS